MFLMMTTMNVNGAQLAEQSVPERPAYVFVSHRRLRHAHVNPRMPECSRPWIYERLRPG